MMLPRLQTFKVRRRRLDEGSPQAYAGPVLEEFYVVANGLTMLANGGVAFQSFQMDPAMRGPLPQIVRVLNDVYDIENVTPAVVEPSVILH